MLAPNEVTIRKDGDTIIDSSSGNSNCGINSGSNSSSGNGSSVDTKPQKRRTLLLKRRALTTGFFDTIKDKDGASSGGGSTGGLVFGITLEQCLQNDNRLNKDNYADRRKCDVSTMIVIITL